VFFAAFLAVMLVNSLMAGRGELTVGQVAPRDLIAQTSFIDRPATERARQQAADRVPEAYTIDPEAPERAVAAVRDAFARLREKRQQFAGGREPTPVELAARADELAAELDLDLPDSVYRSLLTL